MIATRSHHPTQLSHTMTTVLAAIAFALPIGIAGLVAHRTAISDAMTRAIHGGGSQFAPETVEIAPRSFRYRPAGSFNRDGAVVDAPLLTVTLPKPLHIMRYQVSAADYDVCAAAGACKSARENAEAGNVPAVKVSWEDASAYAAWLSRRTGETWRLPTDEEWIMAAGMNAADDAVGLTVPVSDPSQRWLALYEAETEREAPAERAPKPPGAFGVNEYGVADVAGNVWEWTNTCFARATLTDDGAAIQTTSTNCGVRVAEGRHRAYLPNFVRDPRGGACSAGKPPSNVGFRLVREERGGALTRLWRSVQLK